MAGAAAFLRRLALLLALASLVACVVEGAVERPTARPIIRITPGSRQDVAATATVFARQVVPTPTPPGLYIVKPGDTLGRIADEYQTTVDEIMASNNLSDPNLIEVGQQLIIPSLVGPTPTVPIEESAPVSPLAVTAESGPVVSPEASPEPAPPATVVP